MKVHWFCDGLAGTFFFRVRTAEDAPAFKRPGIFGGENKPEMGMECQESAKWK